MYFIKFHIEFIRIFLQLVYEDIFDRVRCFSSCFERLVFLQNLNQKSLSMSILNIASISYNCWALWLSYWLLKKSYSYGEGIYFFFLSVDVAVIRKMFGSCRLLAPKIFYKFSWIFGAVRLIFLKFLLQISTQTAFKNAFVTYVSEREWCFPWNDEYNEKCMRFYHQN